MATHSLPPRAPDPSALESLRQEAQQHPERLRARFAVSTTWRGGVRSDSRVEERDLGGRRVPADFTLRVDEPEALGGADTAPNPHELLLAALNACLVVGYAAACAKAGVTIEDLSIRTSSELDLSALLEVGSADEPACRRMRCSVRLRAKATPEQLAAIHESVIKRSPNGWCIAQPIALDVDLVTD